MAVLERVAVDGLAQGAAPPGYTHTRSTTGLYIDSDGLLKSAAINTPRRQWDAANRRWGYVGEPGRTNSLIQSILPGGGSTPTGWTSVAGSRTALASIYGDADGAAAYQFTSAASLNILAQNVTLANNTTYAFSVDVESVSGTVAINNVIVPTSLPAGCTVSQYYQDGVAVSGSTAVAAGRISLLLGGTYTGAAAGFRIGCGVQSNATGTVVLSRPQLEAGPYPTSYIPTTSGTVSRGADLLTRALTAGEGTALSAQGTLLFEFSFLGGDSQAGASTRYFVSIDDGSSANRIIGYNRSGGIGALGSGATPMDITIAGTIATNTPTKYALAYATNDAAATVGGAAVTTDATCTIPVMTAIAIGGASYTSGFNFAGLIYGWTIYDSRLTNAEIRALTLPTVSRNSGSLRLGLGLGL